MHVLPTVLLLLSLTTLAYYVHRDLAEYARFKLLTETADRQRKYLIWTGKSFLVFTCLTLACLGILGRLHTLTQLPPEFTTLSQRLQIRLPEAQLQISKGFMFAFAGLLLGGLIAGIVLGSILTRKRNSKPIMLGDIEALMPRNGPETACTALLSLNAGLGEELFFRLLLPLLLTLATGNAILAFAIAAIVFGLAHIYQKALGVIATTILGLAFTALYLWTGSLWIAICVHAGFDLIGLVIRPTITRALTPKP